MSTEETAACAVGMQHCGHIQYPGNSSQCEGGGNLPGRLRGSSQPPFTQKRRTYCLNADTTHTKKNWKLHLYIIYALQIRQVE